ncbi:MAG: hypothetical protein MUF60_01525 [Vicinamibacterales bacterium]|nr:hypothetical protein [Vicinamibacterales bacterium]
MTPLASPVPAAVPGGVPAPVAPPAAPAGAPLPDDLAQQARIVYQRALEAQRAGNWAQYGEEIRRLGEILERLAQQAPPRQ